MKKLKLILFLVLCTYSVKAQIGGLSNFEFVNIPPNAHLAGVGGINITIPEVNLTVSNTSLLKREMDKTLSLSYIPYFAGIKNSTLQYIHNFRKAPVSFGLQYFDSGKIDETDENGVLLGTYSVKQYLLSAGTSHTIQYYTIGLNLKFAASQLSNYSALAVFGDIAGTFKHPKRDFTVGLLVKNIGAPIKKYTSESAFASPFDIQVGLTYKLEHMPLRFSVTAHHLYVFDIVYLDPNKKGVLDDQGVEIKPKKSIGDKIGRHFVLGGEFLIGKSLSSRVGYNYLRRREMRLETNAGVAGFSFGGAVKIKSFELAFTHAFYETAKGVSFLTLNTSLSQLFRKKEKFEGESTTQIN